MRYRTLGRTGIKVSPYALGAMMFGAIGGHRHETRAAQTRTLAVQGRTWGREQSQGAGALDGAGPAGRSGWRHHPTRAVASPASVR